MRALERRELKDKSKERAAHRDGRDDAGAHRARTIVLAPALKAPLKAPISRPTLHARPSEPGGKLTPERSSPQARLNEAVGLARAIDLNVLHAGLTPIAQPRPATLFGAGKVEELRGLVEAEAAELVIVDHPLSAVQQRNLERAWNVKVLDRTALILEIFGQRARTREGRLQVELAHLTYQKSRLVRSWTHLERQRGGFGFLGGPGETQIETDRRIIGERILAIRQDLEKVKRTRALHRESRRRVPFPVAALVGYTNAGKSTLFNKLTGAGVLVEDKLFATLDPTMRAVGLPGGGAFVLSDTVGFISDLPTALIAAFRATLEEVIEADLILHVRDISTENALAQKADVESVLAELGIDARTHPCKVMEVWNKTDLLSPEERSQVEFAAARAEAAPVIISAQTGEGLPQLIERIGGHCRTGYVERDVAIEAGDGALVNWLYGNAQVLARRDDQNGLIHMKVRLASPKAARLSHLLTKAARSGPQVGFR